MSKQEDLQKLDRAIKDLEIKLRTGQIAIQAAENETQILNKTHESLKENIRFLKKQSVVALAAEFKKIKDDVTKVQNRLAFLAHDILNIKVACEKIEEALKNAKNQFEIMSAPPVENVVRLDFGRKRG